ncbi:hypothetical protein V6N11_033530 [Hibiscus sabdariffa]|uniref:Uncharacterized protein n=1 Tax=Hibiscus sabdariffa TaxID=183260 RepID=A0ABR2PYE1_9ROSI
MEGEGINNAAIGFLLPSRNNFHKISIAHQSQSLFILLFILSFSFYLKNIYISSLSLVTPKPKPQNQELFAPMASNSKKESTDEKSGKSSKP